MVLALIQQPSASLAPRRAHSTGDPTGNQTRVQRRSAATRRRNQSIDRRQSEVVTVTVSSV